jgi:hypothetical protein
MSKARSCAELAYSAVALLLSACVGTIESPDSWDRGTNASQGSRATASSPVGGLASALECVKPAVGASPLRRLTHAEYDNSVADLLGDNTHPARNFPIDTQVGLFDNTAESQTVPVLLADQYLETAATLAQAVPNVRTLVGCDPTGTSGATCVRGFVERFGRRAYRRPLTADEVTRLLSLYDTARTASDEQTGVRGVVAAVLASPNFLFRPEFGTTGSTIAGAQRSTPFELAGRLSSLLWASVPDDTLLDAAKNGTLATREQVATQARRMLADPKARVAIAAFYDQWLGLAALDATTKDAAVYPAFDDGLRNAMREETRRFVANVLWDGDAKLSTLLTATYSFVNAPLAALYGVKGPSDAATYARVTLDPQQRAGVLTQASMLAAFARPDESSPVKRGKWVRVRMLCQDLPDPPANVPQLPPLEANVSNRERFAMHTNNPACSGCHHLIDGLGFGLERYDGIGRIRTMSQGVAINSSGQVTDTLDIDGAFNGGPELAARLAGSAQVLDCAPTQWLRYAMGRREGADDACSLKAVRDAFVASNGNLRDLMVALTQTDAFWNYRQSK